MPLPLKSETFVVEVITGLRDRDVVLSGDVRFAVAQDRLADPVAVDVDPDQRPIVLPLHGLEMRDASVDAGVLKMNEPPLAGFELDECALVRAVDRRRA